MNFKLIKLLGVVSFLLLTLLILEWFYFQNSHQQLLDDIAGVNHQAYQADELPTLALETKEESDFKTIVERPLFIEGRQEVQTAETDQGQNDEVNLKDWDLTGIYSVGEELTALFVSKQKGAKKKSMKLKQGDDLSGQKLEEIKTDRVVLRQNGQRKVFLLRDPSLKKKRAAPASAAARKTMKPAANIGLKKAETP